MLPSLLFALFLLPASIAVESTCSDRICGSTTVLYPFGFSAGCPIRLNCSASGEVRLGTYPVWNFTASSLILGVLASCNRPAAEAAVLFSDSFAMTASNALFFRDCNNSAVPECSIDPEIISQRLNQTSCGHTGGEIRCYTNTSGRTEEFYSKESFKEMAAGCRFLFTSSRYGKDAFNQSTLVFESAEVGWWLRGDCRCAANATCSRIDLPSGNRTTRYRCSCNEGFTGDGFADGGGCARGHSDRKDQADQHMNVGELMEGIGVGFIAGSCLAVAVVLFYVKLIRK
ncbi:wall-associated receptor kinase-like 14 [Curcuma longa]|uniref:wall-associated receptor kinase-like 14 n=1 Tax=Curcuma longa TaxID=136217 RepID=UPI003D9DD276